MMREYKKYDEYKDSGVEWIGKIPEDWKVVKLKFITECLDNLRVPLNSTERAEMKGNIPYWGANSIVDYVNDWLVDEEVILLGEDGAPFFDKLKNVAFYSNEKIWPNNHVHVLRVNNQNEIKFLIYSLNITDYTAFITGSTRDKLNQSAMSEIPLQLPSQNEQQKIASFLDQKTAEIDEIIMKKESLIEYLKKYKKSVITEAVTKGKLGDKYINEDGELVDKIEMKDSGTQFYGNIPKHLVIKKMKYITKAIIDGAHLTPTYVDDGVPFLRVTDISEGNDIDWKNTKQIPLNEHKQLKARTNPEKGDLLVSKNGTIGKTRVITWDKEFSIFVSLCLLKFVKEIDPFYIAYFFKSYALDEQIKLSGKTNTITNLHLEKIRELELLIPEQDKLQRKIVNYLNKKTNQINNLIQKTKQSIEKYNEYKKSLIFEAVTGKIDLRDYELEGGEELAEHNNSSETERKCLSAVD